MGFLGNDMIPLKVLGHMVDFWVARADLNVNFITRVKAYGFLARFERLWANSADIYA